MKKVIDSIIPFFIFGFAVAIFITLLLLIFHIMFWGLIIGAITWLIVTIKNKFFPKHHKAKTVHRDGRIIEHDDL